MRDHHQQPLPSSSMLTLPLTILFSLLTSIAAAAAAGDSTPYTPTDSFLLNCGSYSNSTSADTRSWDGDASSKFTSTNTHDPSLSSSFRAAEQDPSVTEVPFMTARIFHAPFTYSFPVSSGPKFVRLYFYPVTYSSLNKSQSFFSVTANSHYTLLRNFSAYLTVSATKPPVSTVVKEFIITVLENQQLNLTFSPSPNSYAFVNGIEVISMPNDLYIKQNNQPITFTNQIASVPFLIDNTTTAFETVYRLNVGGSDLSVNGDTGMFRRWRQDGDYIWDGSSGLIIPHLDIPIQYTHETPAVVAPEIVYTTARTMGNQGLNLNFNLTWIFPVDSGFYYLLRLHFCEFQLEVTRENERVFFIFINNQTVVKDADVIHWSGGRGIPVYEEYVVYVPDLDGQRRKQGLWLALHPNMDSKPKYAEAILNGLEIFKLNKSDGSLAGSNPDPTVSPSSPDQHPKSTEKAKSKASFPVIAIAGGVIGVGIISCCLICYLIFRRRRRVKDWGSSEQKSSWVPFSYTSKSTKTSTSSSLPSNLCRRFSSVEIKSATSNFHDDFVIGAGGFGNVYKGCINRGSTVVAIKRLNPSSKQGVHEFETEIKMLSKLRHLHLVSLIGYSDDDGEMILVYDYMSNGTLRDHLYKTKNPPIPWKKRLEICIGAARGLHYLHTGTKHTIIHRDVKSTNILLDEKWVAKVSDFGLSKMGPTDVSHTHVSTVVKGSFGYVDPEYFRRQQLTEKSDVYSFGVVLLEVLCARPAVIQGLPKEQVSLAEWGRTSYQNGALNKIIDKNLRGQIAPDCLRKYGEVAYSCIRDQGIERPTMGDVVWNLEFALQQQEAAEKISAEGGIGVNQTWMASPLGPHGEVLTTDEEDPFLSSSCGHVSNSRSSDTSGISSGKRSSTGDGHDHNNMGNESVFSEIISPKGR